RLPQVVLNGNLPFLGLGWRLRVAIADLSDQLARKLVDHDARGPCFDLAFFGSHHDAAGFPGAPSRRGKTGPMYGARAWRPTRHRAVCAIPRPRTRSRAPII